MPIHLKDLDVVSAVAGLSSVFNRSLHYVTCIDCGRERKKPFMQFFRSFLKSPPFEKYIMTLQSRLGEKGVNSKVFKSHLYHQWFLCMWTSGRRKKLQKYAKKYQAVIVLGCNSAPETVCDLVKSTDCRVFEGIEVAGFMNVKLRFHLLCNVSFEPRSCI